MNALVRKRTLKEDGTQTLTGAAFDHAGNTVTRRNCVADEVRKILLQDDNASQMIIDSDHIVEHTPFCEYETN